MFIVEMGNNFHQGNIHSLNHWKETNFSIYTNSVIYLAILESRIDMIHLHRNLLGKS